MMKISSIITCLIASVLSLPASFTLAAQADTSAAEWFEHSPDRAWLQPYDPTLISRRISSEFSYESHDNDSDIYKIETTLRWAFPVREDLALGVQAMVPVKWINSPTTDDSGTGDLELRTGFIGRLSPVLRYGAGLNAAFDTASDSSLGGNAFQLRPILAVRWDAHPRISTGINIEYTFTPRDEGTSDVSALELKFPVTFKLNEEWSASMTYKPRWDLLAETDRNRIELSAAKTFGTNRQYALSCGAEVPLSSESFDFKLITGFAWSF